MNQRLLMILLATCAACKTPPKDPSCPNSLCSNHGVCAAPGEFPTCACDPGYEGDTCALCSTGYHTQGGACVKNDVCVETSCGTHGTCSVDKGVAYCVCEDGYSGEDCTTCYVGYHATDATTCALDEQCLPRSCSAAGTCTVDKGLVSCACDPGYTGSTCETCDTGYHRGLGDACLANDSCASVDPCAHPGECDDTSGVAVCNCQAGYTGVTCSDCYPGYHNVGGGVCSPDTECIATSCAGNGSCDGTGGVVTCTCTTEYAGANCTQCATGFHLLTDPIKSFVCVADEVCGASAPAPCMVAPTGPSGAIPPGGNQTTCDDSTKVVKCICAEGYAGPLCDTCAVGYRDRGGLSVPVCVPKEHCMASSCGLRADGITPTGSCDDSTGVIVCTCDTSFDYIGQYCEQSFDNCASNGCNSGTPGVCVDLDHGGQDLYSLTPPFAPTGDGKDDGDYVCICPSGSTAGGHSCN